MEPEMTPWQAVARIRSITGTLFKLPHGASAIVWSIQDEVISLKFQVNRVAGRKGGEVIQPVYMTMKTWHRTPDGWQEQPDMTGSLRKEKGQFIHSFDLRTPLDTAERERWVSMGDRD